MNHRLNQTSSTLRAGNALILVIGILVLLVLVATAFITRVQSGRVTTSAQRDSAEINDQARAVGRFVADEIALALFCQEVTPAISQGSANEPRRSPSPEAIRYGSDNDELGDGLNPKPFNFAPYEVVPWTNPPDGGSIPSGPANPLGGPSFGDSRWLRDTEPQRMDLTADGTPETFSHWRHLTNLSRSGNAWRIAFDISDITNGGLLTNLDIPVEQWPALRPALDLSLPDGDEGQYPALSSDPSGQDHFTLMTGWLNGGASSPTNQGRFPQNFLDLSDLDGDTVHNGSGERSIDGFTRGTIRWNVERTLTDTDGDGFTDAFWHLSPHSLGSDTMQLVAVSITDNSARGNMNVATKFERSDSSSGYQDGEATKGHTPADIALVGDADVGFLDNPANSPGVPNSGSWVDYDGLTDSTVTWDSGQWAGDSNASILDELGIEINGNTPNPNLEDISPAGNLSSTNDIYSSYGRRWYWQLAGRDPFSATNGFHPYTTADELELRIVEGNNYQFVGSRLERSLNSVDSSNTQFIRSSYLRHEASELRDQLNNKELLFDNRRKLTAFSGVRNDLLAPWLRWEERFWQRNDSTGTLPRGYDAFKLESYNNDFQPWGSLFPPSIPQEVGEAMSLLDPSDPDYLINLFKTANFVVNTWREQSRTKVDLREYYDPTPPTSSWAIWWESNADGKLTLSQRAPLQILLAMTDAQEKGVSSLDFADLPARGPLGTYTEPDMDAQWTTDGPVNNYYQQARLMSAGLASNIMSYLDADDRWRDHSPFATHISGVTPKVDTPLSSVVPPPVLGNNGWEEAEEGDNDLPYADVPVLGPNDGDIVMLGLEAQPFIMEAFIGHAHGAETEEYDPGACCLDGFCEMTSELTCVALNGTFEGSENCLLANCEYGACCLPDGGCIVMRPSNCNTLQGEYRGDGTICELNKCIGRCCLYMGTCEELSLRSCTELGGAFAGYETQCAGDCQTLGACCVESGSCVDVLSQEACSSLGGTYRSLQFCNADPCTTPCCLDYTQCVDVTTTACNELGGVYFGQDQNCTELSCQAAGSCCVGSESCTEVASLQECNTINGDFIAGVQCVEAPCNSSCCLGEGTCIEVSLGICISLDGTYIQGYACDISPCRSACCFYTGGCEVMLQDTCDLFGGEYKVGEYCVDSPCVPTGACCLPDDGGCLQDLLETSCLALGGTYTGDGVGCGTVPCGESQRGACCLDTGYCQDVFLESACNDIGGEFQGVLVRCEELPAPCSDTSACCVGNGTCLELEIDNCANIGGDFNPGQTCADNVCLGACCFPLGICLDNYAVDCLEMGGTFIFDRSCDTEPCLPIGACCISSQFCDELTSDMCIITLGGSYEGDETTCVSDPCALGVEGACCMEPFGCVMVIQAMCDEANGIWDSSGSCLLETCSNGSCCLDNGTTANCVDTTNSSSCDILGGIYTAGQLCATDPCVGACCLWAGGCEMMSMDSCDELKDPDGNGEWETNDAPGYFQGVGEPCGPVACAPSGSCCLMSDTCVDIVGVRDFTEYCEVVLGGIYRPGEFCADSDCGGACCLAFSPCSYVPEEQCIELGGTYAGDGVSCFGPDQIPDTGDEPCVFEGACCFGSGSCIDVSEEAHCDNLGGTYKSGEECIDTPCIQYFIVNDNPDPDDRLWSDFQGTYAVVQLANPFNRLIDLQDYSVEFFGKEFKFDSIVTPGVPDPTSLLLPPATPENPATLILYAFPEDADMPDASIFADPLDPTIPDLNQDWKDFLDIEEDDHPQDDVNTVDDPNTVPYEGVEKTLIIKVPSFTSNLLPGWETTRGYYDDLDWNKDDTEYNAIALYKFDEDQRVLIDRIDAPGKSSGSTLASRVSEDLERQWNKVGDTGYVNTFIPFEPNTETILVHWDRVTRAWGLDVPEDGVWPNDTYDATERNPRYVFAANDFIRNGDDVDDLDPTTFPAEPEFNGKRRITKNVYAGSQIYLEHSSEFHWTEFVDPDDFDGSGELDDNAVFPADDDELTDFPDPWFTTYLWHPSADDSDIYDGVVHGGYRHRKPTFFDMNKIENPPFPDKGWYGQTLNSSSTTSVVPAYADTNGSGGIDIDRDELNMGLTFPLQMLQKDDDFDQVGELLNVWLFGHMLEGDYFPPFPPDEDFDYNLELPLSHLDHGTQVNAGTVTTFSEFMYPNWQIEDWWAPLVGIIDEDDELILDERVNRLRFLPRGSGGENSEPTPLMMGGRSEYIGPGQADALNHPWPRQAIATRILDSFVCDGPGRVDFTGDAEDDDLSPIASSQYEWPSIHSLFNANGFSGKATPGMININTAPVEVLRMLPHMYKVVHRTSAGTGNPRSSIPEAMVQWREGANGGWSVTDDTGIPGGTDYSDRALTLEMELGTGPKQTRGFSSPAEIGLLRPVDPLGSYAPDDAVGEPWSTTKYADAWRIDFAALEPFDVANDLGTHISTDVNRADYYGEDSVRGDEVSGDAEEINMLQAGISNLISTNSDMFTVHMRIRTFKRNPITALWDATDLRYIIDDSRYVMLVDRSNVNTPADKPRIVYFEKLPN
jgi:hypothetical protein